MLPVIVVVCTIVVVVIELLLKQRHSLQNSVTTSGPQQSPPSKLHSILLLKSSQNPSPIYTLQKYNGKIVLVVACLIVGVVIEVPLVVNTVTP